MNEILEKYFTRDGMGFLRPKSDYIVVLDLFVPDFISYIEGNMAYSMASDNRYDLNKLTADDIAVYKRVIL